jgi:hypothetical protein
MPKFLEIIFSKNHFLYSEKRILGNFCKIWHLPKRDFPKKNSAPKCQTWPWVTVLHTVLWWLLWIQYATLNLKFNIKLEYPWLHSIWDHIQFLIFKIVQILCKYCANCASGCLIGCWKWGTKPWRAYMVQWDKTKFWIALAFMLFA